MLHALPSNGDWQRWGGRILYLHDFLAWQKHQACGIWRDTGLNEHAPALLLLRPLHTCNGVTTSDILANLSWRHRTWCVNG